MKKNKQPLTFKNKTPYIHGVLDYRTFFGRPAPVDPIEKLAKYPTDVLILMLAKINAIIFESQAIPSQKDGDIFRLVFSKIDNEISHLLIQTKLTDSKENSVIFTSQAIVGLMAKLIAKYRPLNESDTVNESEEKVLQLELFEAILATNDSYYNRADKTDLMSRAHIWKLELLQQHFVRGVTNMYGVNPLKVFLFFRFMSERFGEDILKEFADAFGVPSAYNFYFVFLQTIVSSYSGYEKDKQPRYCIVDDTLEKVLEPFIYDPSKPQSGTFSGDAFALINQPFYRFTEGVAVLDFDFFGHLTDISLIYYFYRVTSLKKKHGIKNYNEYLGLIGKHYFEQYLVLQLIKQIFTHRHDSVLTEDIDLNYPDILILQNKKDVFVVEVKSTRVNGRTLDQADMISFQKYLEDEFANEKEAAGEKNKGIFQLKSQIEHLKAKGSKFRIFPVIVYTEPSMDISGVNSFLDQKFDDIVSAEKSYFIKIYPLTLINLHFFIKYYPQLKADRYFLRNKITEYHNRKKSLLKESSKNDNPFTYLIAEYSFMKFMEQEYPAGNPMSYFKTAATDFGFREQAHDATISE
jgi:hypothetical protein